MQKLEITVVVPEEIAALVQHYIQFNLCGEGSNSFIDYLCYSDVENPEHYIPEMEIGIKHPDDEPVKIMDYDRSQNKDVCIWLNNKNCQSYLDLVLDENLFSITCLDEINVNPPQHVLDFIESVKATGCSYFRFIK
jgi:hypothetical protein